MRVLAALSFLFQSVCAHAVLPASDHFDGQRFFNPENRRMISLSDGIKVLWEFKAEEWPLDMTNTHQAQITEALMPGQIRLTFVNHATVLIELPGLNLLTDPVWAERASPVQWAGPKRRRQPGMKLKDLPKIDVVLISHNHYDHLDLATLKIIAQRDQPQVLVPLNDKNRVEAEGIRNVQELDWWQTTELTNGTRIHFTPTQHFSSRGIFDRNKSLWGAYFVEHQGQKIYFGGDTGYSTYFKQTYDRLGAPDVALLPIGAFEPRWFMSVMHMGPDEAVQAHKDLKAKKSVAIHFGTFALTEESPQRAVSELKLNLKSQNVSEDDFVVLGEGESRVFP